MAVSSNDPASHPEDAPERMREEAEAAGYPFPYCFDETQDVAKVYGAVCTPDFFGFNAEDELQYRGRLDESKTTLVPDAERELDPAMTAVARTGRGPAEQTPSMGCSIKWAQDSGDIPKAAG